MSRRLRSRTSDPCVGEPQGARARWPPGRTPEGLGRRRRVGHARKIPRDHRRCVERRWLAATMERCNDQGAAQEERSNGVWHLSWHLPRGSHVCYIVIFLLFLPVDIRQTQSPCLLLILEKCQLYGLKARDTHRKRMAYQTHRVQTSINEQGFCG